MSIKEFTSLVQEHILKHINDYEKSTRHEMNLEVTAMEITPELLKKNFTTVTKLSEARELYTEIEHIVVSSSNTYPFNAKTFNEETGIRYKYKDGEGILLIASSYNNLRRYLTTNLSRNKNLINGPLGIHTAQLVDKEGVLRFEDDAKTIPIMGQRSKFDIGHTVGFGQENKNAVSAARIFNALSIAGPVGPLDLQKMKKEYLDSFSVAHRKYKGDSEKTVDITKDIVKSDITFVYTVMQESSVNQKLGAVEKKILQRLKSRLMTAKSSWSIIQMLQKQLAAIFLGKKTKKIKTKTSVSGKLDNPKPKISINTHKGGGVVSHKIEHQAPSMVNITALLDPIVRKYVKINMDYADYFKTKDNIFTPSVKIKSAIQQGNYLDVEYDYDIYPYGVFEKGKKLHKPGREPSRVIHGSIRAAARELIYKGMNINIRGPV